MSKKMRIIILIIIILILICSIPILNYINKINKGKDLNNYLSNFIIKDKSYKFDRSCGLVFIVDNKFYDCNSKDNSKILEEFIEMIKKAEPHKVNKNNNKYSKNNNKYSKSKCVYAFFKNKGNILKNDNIMFIFKNSEYFNFVSCDKDYQNEYKLKYKLDDNFYEYFIEKYHMVEENRK